MGYFGSEGIYDSNLSFWGKKFKKKFLDPTQLLENAPVNIVCKISKNFIISNNVDF